jgi:hypothetical protein
MSGECTDSRSLCRTVPYNEPSAVREGGMGRVAPASRWGVGNGTAGALGWCHRFVVASARPARASTRWRSMAR